MITLVAAIDRKRGIGKDGNLPWRLPADLAHFKRQTIGRPVIMGHKTHRSIGRTLPDRRNIILTRTPVGQTGGVEVVNSVEDALALADPAHEDVMVIGGGEVYRQTLPLAQRLILTVVDGVFDCDTFFPDFTGPDYRWELVSKAWHEPDGRNAHRHCFATLKRVYPIADVRTVLGLA